MSARAEYDPDRGVGLDQGRTRLGARRPVGVVFDVNRADHGRARMIDYGQGRRCTTCDAKLNRYNAGPGCSLHPDAPGVQAGMSLCPGCDTMRSARSFTRANGYVSTKCHSCTTKRYRRSA